MEIQVNSQQTPMSVIQHKVEIERVNYRNEENGWTVISARDIEKSCSFIAVGHFAEVCQGEYYILFGRWASHKSFGKQFKIERAVSSRPQSRIGISRFLSSGLFKGVGEKTAKKIVKHLGLETLNILDTDPERLKLIPKLGKKTASNIIKTWQGQKQTNEIIMFLYNHGITASKARKIIKLYGGNAERFLSENPYRLIKDLQGIGFLTADRIAESVGLEKDHPQRVQAGILYLLSIAEEQGHCYLETEQLVQKASHILKLPKASSAECIEKNSKILARELRIVTVSKNKTESSKFCNYLSSLYCSEKQLASYLLKLSNASFVTEDPTKPQIQARIKKWTEQFCEKTGTNLSSEQQEAVLLAASRKTFILTGGPGVGKTTTANTIIRLLKAMGRSVALAAPTGRAAQRMSEVSSETSKTIHRLLEWSAQERCFKRDEINKLTSSVIIIDEASMLDVKLANHLLAAIPESSQLILIGDSDQLPSVGPGNVLKDLIESGVIPSLKLKQIFRQAQTSQIIQTAHMINSGKSPDFKGDEASDCRFIQVDQGKDILACVHNLLTKSLPEAGYDAVKDVQILTPMNKGEIGCLNLNTHIQDWLNPEEKAEVVKKFKFASLRQKDKVIQNVNNYELGVFNGDIGYVDFTGVEGAKLLVHFGSKKITYEEEQASDMNLAYSITIHKSQGSEFPVVIIPVSMSHYVMLQKNLIYTALTRAKKLAIFVGEKKAIDFAVRNTSSSSRQTRLVALLRGDVCEA